MNKTGELPLFQGTGLFYGGYPRPLMGAGIFSYHETFPNGGKCGRKRGSGGNPGENEPAGNQRGKGVKRRRKRDESRLRRSLDTC